MDKKNLVVGPGEADNEHFGEILERLRKRAGLSRMEAAKAIGVTSEYIRLIERGKRTPAAGQMPKIMGAYGIHGDAAFFGERSVTVDGHVVEFNSRILEARGKSELNRDERIGRVVRLLVTADPSVIEQIYKILQRN